MRQEASASIEHLAHAFKSIAAQISCIVSGLRWIRFRYLSFNSLRSRGGHGLPAFTAARLASRIATICFACARVSSRRLASPPRLPMAARYSPTFFCASFISMVAIMYHKRLMMRANSNGNSKSVSASRRCNGCEATARLSNQHASRVRSPDFRRRRVAVADDAVDFHGTVVRLSEVIRYYQSSENQ